MRSILFVLITIPGALIAQQAPYDVCPPADPPYYRVRYEEPVPTDWKAVAT